MMMAYLSWRAVTAIHLGPVVIRPHGVLIATGILAGALLMRRYTRRRGIPDEKLWDVLWWAVIGGLVGMRATWLLGHWRELHDPLEAVAVWHGGMSLLGGLIGAVAVGVPVALRAGLPVLTMLDFASPGIAFGIAIGRVSDLIIGDHLGKPTTLPWGFRYLGAEHPLAGVPPVGAVVHPVALYDLILTTALLAALVWFLRRPRAPGSAIALFTLWYGAERLLIDFARTDPVRAIGLTGSQLTALIAIVAVAAALLRRTRDKNRGATDRPLASAGAPA